jgi:uncharacterized protein YbjQ (UPF0145 family)
MLIVTTHGLPGYEIHEVLGEVLGVAQRRLGRGGGSSTEFEAPGAGPGGAEGGAGLLETRRSAVAEMAQNAHRRGATAVVGLSFDTVDLAGRSIEVCAYGTAVLARRILDHAGRAAAQPAPAGVPTVPPAVGAMTGAVGAATGPAPGGYPRSDPHRDVTMSGVATGEQGRDTADHVQQIRRMDRQELPDDDITPRSAGVRDVTISGDQRRRPRG